MPTPTAEDYLKRLYYQQRTNPEALVPMGQLAAAVGVVPGTATTMVKSLTRSGWVRYEPRAGVRLTSVGQRLALAVLRRHRLVELFLVQVLGLDWSEVDEEAEQLEHVISERVLEKIDALLGHPAVDPHGDPIPTSDGKVREQRAASLADCPLDQPVRIVRIVGQDSQFLQFLKNSGLTPGTTVTAHQRHPVAETVVLRIPHHPPLSLGLPAAQRILVVPAQ